MKNNVLLFFFIFFATFFLPNESFSQWVATGGPGGGYINAFTVSGSNLFAGTTGGGIFRSSDNGASWETCNSGLTNLSISCFAVSGPVIFAGAWDGLNGDLYRSTNNGDTWTETVNGLTHPAVSSMAVIGRYIFVGTEGGGVFRSTDDGGTWESVSLGLTNPDILTLTAIGTNLFAGTWIGGVSRSTDYGANWSPVNVGLPNMAQVNVLANDGTKLFAAVDSIFLSTNNGNSWTSISQHGLPRDPIITSLVVSNSYLFAGTRDSGIYVSTNTGSSWSSASIGLPTKDGTQAKKDILCFYIKGTDVFTGTNRGGVYRSSNNGANWVESNYHLANTEVQDFAVIGNKMFAAIYGGVFVTTDNGTSWIKINNGLINDIAIFIEAIGTDLYVGTEGGLFRSTNNGANWSALNTGLPASAMIVTSIVSYGSNLFLGTFNGVYLSTNNGASWTRKNSGISSSLIMELTIVGSNIFAATTHGIFRSTNSAANWTEVSTGLSTDKNIYAFAVSGNNLFAGDSDYGVFLSTNNGANWTQVNSGLDNTRVYSLLVNGSDIYAGTYSGGIFHSTNNGTSWTSVNNGLSNKYIFSMIINNSYFFAGTQFGGVYRIPVVETPVELTSFTASILNNNVELNWKTSTELNNRGFEIQRRLGTSGFETIGFVKGNGTTTDEHIYKFSDSKLSAGKYTYRLKQNDFNGSFAYSKESNTVNVTPGSYSLEQNYPNPFNPSTTIDFNLVNDSKVILKVYDVTGREVATLINGTLKAGIQSVQFNAAALTSGVYMYKIEAYGLNGSSFSAIKKMILIK